MTILSVSLSFGPQNSETKMAAAQPEGHGEDHGHGRDAEGADDQRQHAVADVARGGRVPLGAEEELAEVELLVPQDRGRFAEDEEEDASTKKMALTPQARITVSSSFAPATDHLDRVGLDLAPAARLARQR